MIAGRSSRITDLSSEVLIKVSYLYISVSLVRFFNLSVLRPTHSYPICLVFLSRSAHFVYFRKTSSYFSHFIMQGIYFVCCSGYSSNDDGDDVVRFRFSLTRRCCCCCRSSSRDLHRLVSSLFCSRTFRISRMWCSLLFCSSNNSAFFFQRDSFWWWALAFNWSNQQAM